MAGEQRGRESALGKCAGWYRFAQREAANRFGEKFGFSGEGMLNVVWKNRGGARAESIAYYQRRLLCGRGTGAGPSRPAPSRVRL